MYSNNSIYPNLEAELARANINKKDLAAVVGVSKNTLYSRLNGKTDLTLSEARIIRAHIEKKTGRVVSFLNLFNITH